METQPLTLVPELMAALSDYAKRNGQDMQAALNDVLFDYFAWERQDHEETVAAVLEGIEDVKAGRTKPAEDVYAALRLKHGL